MPYDEDLLRDFPSRRRRPRRRQDHAWQVIVRIGRSLYYLLMTAVVAVLVVLAIGHSLDGNEPLYWGTFTEEHCDPKPRNGCRSFGTWVSDDRTVVLKDIALDGSPDDDGSARASYRPTGFSNDADNQIVHREEWSNAGQWLPWVLAVIFLGYTVHQAHSWGDLSWLGRLSRRRRPEPRMSESASNPAARSKRAH